MSEVWHPAKGFEPYLEVSNLGRVKRKKRFYSTLVEIREQSRVIPPVNHGVYKAVQVMTRDGRKRNLMLHRLIAATFIPSENKRLQVRHKNGDKSDNRVENLYWAIPKR